MNDDKAKQIKIIKKGHLPPIHDDLNQYERYESWTSTNKEPQIDLSDDFFGAVLNCAVRYCIGRQSYMPALVIDFITPLLPYLSKKTLWCFKRDISEANSLGDKNIDEPKWEKFLEKVQECSENMQNY